MREADIAYVLRQASCRASVLVTTAGFSRDKSADLRQEFVLDYLGRERHFDPDRGEWRKFAAGVMRNHSTVLFRRLKRRQRWEVLESELQGQDEKAGNQYADLLDTLPTDDHSATLELSIDVRRVLNGLPTALQTLAVLMATLPAGEIHLRIGKSRTRVYQMRRELQTAFRQAGYGPSSRRERV